MIMSCAALLERNAEPERRGCSSRDQRPHLPLRHLSARHRRDARRRQSAQGLTMAKRAKSAHREISVRHRQRRPRHGGAAGSRRRAAAAAAQQRARRDRQVVPAPERPRQGHRRDALHRRHRAARHAARPRSALAACRMRWCAPSTCRRRRAIPACARSLPIADPTTIRTRATLRYVGAPVAAVAAVSMAAAEEALHLIRVDYQALPFVVAWTRRAIAGAPLVHDETTAPAGHPSGFPAAGESAAERQRARARHRQARRRRRKASPRPTSSSRANTAPRCRPIAAWSRTPSSPIGARDGLTVYMSTQFTAGVRHELAEEFGLPLNRVRVVVDAMGGGFGSKSSLGNYGRIAVELSRRAQAPVRLFLERDEEQMDAGNRPGTWQRLRIGAKRDGALTAISLSSYGTAGVGARRRRRQQSPRRCIPARISKARNTTSSSMPGRAAPCAAPAIRPARSGSNRRSTNWPRNSASIRSRCATESIPVRCGARSGASAPSGSAGSGATRPAPMPGPVKRGLGMAQSLWGANVQTQRGLRGARDARRLGRGAVERAGYRHRHRHGAGADRRRGARACVRTTSPSVSATPSFPRAGPPTAAARPPRSRRRRAPPLGACCKNCSARRRSRSMPLPTIWSRATGKSWCATDPSRSMRFRDAAARLRTDRISAVASRSDDYARLPPADGRRRAWRSRTWAACSSPKWRSTPRPASCVSSASSRCRIAAGR